MNPPYSAVSPGCLALRWCFHDPMIGLDRADEPVRNGDWRSLRSLPMRTVSFRWPDGRAMDADAG